MIKQVIIIRKDLNMRKGKMIAQGCHASLQSLFDCNNKGLSKITTNWFTNGQTKIVLGIDSLDQLKLIFNKANEMNLPCSLILDSGKTEFKEPTYTACAIGPYDSDIIDTLTSKLKLL